MGKKKAVVGVDLGGTSLFVVVLDVASGEILSEAKRKTRPKFGAVDVTARMGAAIIDAIKSAGLEKKQILGVGVGVPGPVQVETGLVVNCPNMGDTWDHFFLRDELSALLGTLPLTIDNDVNVGAVGEHRHGAGQGSQSMLAIFVGTGIGGGLILNGSLYTGSRHSAGEVGHMVIADGGAICGCGQAGHAEALASRTAIDNEIKAAIQAGKPTIVPELLRQKGRDTISSAILERAVEAGDEVTLAALQKAQYYLGILIANCVNILDPEVIVVGGGVVERLGEAYLEPVRPVARQHYINKLDADRVRIVPAALGDYSGAIGAAELAKQRFG